jgi:hypothetical protein
MGRASVTGCRERLHDREPLGRHYDAINIHNGDPYNCTLAHGESHWLTNSIHTTRTTIFERLLMFVPNLTLVSRCSLLHHTTVVSHPHCRYTHFIPYSIHRHD